MDIEEFIFIRYRDNVILVSDFRSRMFKDFGLMKDDSIRVINRIFDYQRKEYGDILDTNSYQWYTKEELRKIGINAQSRRHRKKLYNERR